MNLDNLNKIKSLISINVEDDLLIRVLFDTNKYFDKQLTQKYKQAQKEYARIFNSVERKILRNYFYYATIESLENLGIKSFPTIAYTNEDSDNQDKVIITLKKISLDNSSIPCPSCMTTIQSGNSYPEMFLRSYECKNPNCQDRSKSGRGKRFDEYGTYRNLKLEEYDFENIISNKLYTEWRRDIFDSKLDSFEMLAKFYTWEDETIGIYNFNYNNNTFHNRKIVTIDNFTKINSKNNFLIAISKGIVTESTQKMLLDLETKLNNLKEQITIEETALSCQVSREDIIRHFAVAIKKDPAVMINLLIDKIILYDDKIEIYYKSLTNKSPDKRQDFLIYNNEVYYDKTRVVKNLYLTQTNHKKVVLKLLQFIAA